MRKISSIVGRDRIWKKKSSMSSYELWLLHCTWHHKESVWGTIDTSPHKALYEQVLSLYYGEAVGGWVSSCIQLFLKELDFPQPVEPWHCECISQIFSFESGCLIFIYYFFPFIKIDFLIQYSHKDHSPSSPFGYSIASLPFGSTLCSY